MTDHIAIRPVVIELLKYLSDAPEVAIDLYEIGPPLIAQGFNQDQIADVLIALEREKVIALDGTKNCLIILKTLP